MAAPGSMATRGLSPASASWSCETTKEAEEGTTSATSASLAAGSWYFHVCARDNAGNWGAVASAGPFQITDTTLPTTCALPFERKWGSFGTGAGQFRRPFGVGAGPGGEVVVADFDNGRLQLFDGQGNFVRQWSTAGGPVSVALDSHGHAVVSNLYAANVQVFALDGTLVDQWATGSPYGLTVDATDHVYAVNDAANVVTKYDHDGNFVLQFGSAGTGNGQFLRAWGVATAPGGDVFVTDVNGHTVQRFTSAGAFVGKWGSYGAGAGQLNAPAGITISPAGVVYVSEVANRRIQAFTLEGFPLCAWGSSGSGDGQFLDPLNVAFSSGHLYVADHLNHRIQKFGLDEIPPSDPTSTSTSPPASTWTNDNTVQVTWSGAADNPRWLRPRGLLSGVEPLRSLDAGRGGGCAAHRRSALDDEPGARRRQRLVLPPAHLRPRGQLHGDGARRAVLDRHHGAVGDRSGELDLAR